MINEGVLSMPGGDEKLSMTLIREIKAGLEFTVPSGALASGQSLVSPYGGGTVVFAGQPRPNDFFQADLMAGEFGLTGTHPDYPLEDWAEAVSQEETRSSYWAWVERELKNSQHDFFELD